MACQCSWGGVLATECDPAKEKEWSHALVNRATDKSTRVFDASNTIARSPIDERGTAYRKRSRSLEAGMWCRRFRCLNQFCENRSDTSASDDAKPLDHLGKQCVFGS